MESENLKVFDALSVPPDWAMKRIAGGRLTGKTDINPQWRIKAMTEQFGPVGTGWRWEIIRLWTEPAPAGQVFAFAHIHLFVGDGAATPGIGGSMLVEQEAKGLYANDEAFKMAITDALSTAMKMHGVGSAVYEGRLDSGGGGGGKYDRPAEKPTTPWTPPGQRPAAKPCEPVYVKGVEETSGTSGKGPWTRYTVIFSTGASCSTFDAGVADLARACIEHNNPCTFETEQKGKYLNLKSITPTEKPGTAAEVNDDGLPF
jgi:hypothetical protein